MRVLIINAVCGSGSTGRITSDMYALLKKKGHEVKIVYGVGKATGVYEGDLIRCNNKFGYYLHNALARLTDGAGYFSTYATSRLIRKIKAYDPDVIQLHNIHGFYINIEILFEYLKKANKKVVWTLHDCWAFTGHSAYCDAAKCEKWKTGCFKCPQIHAYPKAVIDRSERNWKRKKACFTGVPNLTIVTPSYWLAGLTKQSFLGGYPIEVIHNGIDISQFQPLRNDFREFYRIEDKYIILGVATAWDDMKGYSDFIKLADSLDERYQIVMVGLTEEQIQKLPPNVLGIKRTSSVKELVYIYSSADVFINLTYCDNYPTVNLEARACGTPVITYDTGGSAESAGDAGILVKQGDIGALIREIERIRKLSFVANDDLKQVDQKRLLKKNICQYRVDNSDCGGYWSVKNGMNLVTKCTLLGVASVWEKRKGLSDFIKLSEILNEDYQILLVGVTDEQMEALPIRIKGICKTESIEQLAALYSISDVFINPTYEDNFPTTNIEAIACGVPVITYNTGGSGEAIDDNSGIIVEQGNVLGIKRALNTVMHMDTMQIRKRAEKYNRNDKYQEYLHIYQRN